MGYLFEVYTVRGRKKGERVSYIVDRKNIDYNGRTTIRFEQLDLTEDKKEKIIVTVPYEYERIAQKLIDYGVEKERILCVKKMFAEFLI